MNLPSKLGLSTDNQHKLEEASFIAYQIKFIANGNF